MILKTVTLTANGREPVVVTAPPAPAAATVSVALPTLAPGTYSAAWTAEGPDFGVPEPDSLWTPTTTDVLPADGGALAGTPVAN